MPIARLWARRAWTSIVGVLRGIILLLLHSRVAPKVAEGLTLLALVFASLPDGGVRLSPYVYFPGIIALYLMGAWIRNLVHGTRIAAYGRTSIQLGQIIGSLASHTAGDDAPQILRTPDEAVGVLLRRAKELSETWLRIPVGTEVCANLLLPVAGENGDPIGLQATKHDDYQPGRRHDIIPLDAPGGPEAFLSGDASSIPNTDEVSHPRLRGRPYKSIGSFPIYVGEPANNGRIVAVLAIDASRAYVFDQGAVRQLEPFIAPIAQLIGLALELKNKGTHD